MTVGKDHFYRLKQLSYLSSLDMPLQCDGLARVLLHNNRWMVIVDKTVLAISDSRHHVGPYESLRLAHELNDPMYNKMSLTDRSAFQVRAENPIPSDQRLAHLKKAYKMFKRQKKYRDFGDNDK